MKSYFRRLFDPRKTQSLLGPQKKRRAPRARLHLEALEDRVTPAAPTLEAFPEVFIPTGQAFHIAINGDDADDDVLNFTAVSDNADVQVEVTPQTNTYLVINVTIDGVAQDPMIFELFGDLTPETVAQISDLVNDGFYTDRIFHRIIPDFVAQFGNDQDGNFPNNLPRLDDEYDTRLTFTGFGQLAMAKTAADDSGTGQVFITDADLSVAGATKRPPQHLNFDHTIFGQITEGVATLEAIIAKGTAGGSPTADVVITSAEIVTDADPGAHRQNGVLRIRTTPGFTGTATITVTASDGTDQVMETITVNVVPDTNDSTADGTPINSKPFLVTDGLDGLTAVSGRPLVIDLDFEDIDLPLQQALDQTLDRFFFMVAGAETDRTTLDENLKDGNLVNPVQNASVEIDQTTGRLTITPNIGFKGQLHLIVGVRDDRHGTTVGGNTEHGLSTFDTQIITVDVEGTDFGPRFKIKDNKLFISGTNQNDKINITLSDDSSNLVVTSSAATEPRTFPVANIRSITIRGRDGDDEIVVDERVQLPTRISGQDGDDTVRGGSGPNLIFGGRGDDFLVGGVVDDHLRGGEGDDVLMGGDGNDRLKDKAGRNMLIGGNGNDIIDGGPGDDRMDGGAGTDVLHGGTGQDVVFGGPGRDRLVGGPDQDEFGPDDTDDRHDGFDEDEDLRPGTFTDADLKGDRADLFPNAPLMVLPAVIQSGAIDYEDLGFDPDDGHLVPTYGPHHANPVTTGVRNSELDPADVLANLDRGHIWIVFNSGQIGDRRTELEDLVSAFGLNSGVILSPEATLQAQIVVASWGRIQTFNTFDPIAILDFIFANRAHGPSPFTQP